MPLIIIQNLEVVVPVHGSAALQSREHHSGPAWGQPGAAYLSPVHPGGAKGWLHQAFNPPSHRPAAERLEIGNVNCVPDGEELLDATEQFLVGVRQRPQPVLMDAGLHLGGMTASGAKRRSGSRISCTGMSRVRVMRTKAGSVDAWGVAMKKPPANSLPKVRGHHILDLPRGPVPHGQPVGGSSPSRLGWCPVPLARGRPSYGYIVT